MQQLGFIQSKYNASLYYNPSSDVRVLVHGDDFVAVGDRGRVGEFRKRIAARFTVKDKVVGPRSDLGEIRETRILNRIIRVTPKGWEYEADQRHADIIVQELNLRKARSVKTPGEDEPSWKEEEMRRTLGSSR